MSKTKWIAGVLFWAFFLLSVALNARYRVDRLDLVRCPVALSTCDVNLFRQRAIHHRTVSGARGYPRWFLRFAFDEDDGTDKDGLNGRIDVKS